MGSKITMFNPQSDVTQEASRDAYDRVYRDQGWTLVDNPAPKEDPDLVAARAEADGLGVAYRSNMKAETIRKAIDDHKAEQAKKTGGS